MQPALGAFPELVEKSGAGTTYHPNTPDQLAATLHNLINDKPKLIELSQQGARSAEVDFNIYKQADLLAGVYEGLNVK